MNKTQESKEAKLTGTEVIVQSNTLIDFPKKLDLQEQKLFLFLVSKIDPYDDQQQMCFRITVNDFAKAQFNIKQNITNNYYIYNSQLIVKENRYNIRFSNIVLFKL